MSYSPDQIAIATESFGFWKSTGLPWVSCIGMLAMEDGETSFNPHAVGDRDKAFGPFQWHQDRIDAIKAGCGIDVKTASHLDQLKGAQYELKYGWYKHVWSLLLTVTTISGAVMIGVSDYEQSGSQGRDITRRAALAQHWATVFPNS
jgi:hypothetical protein